MDHANDQPYFEHRGHTSGVARRKRVWKACVRCRVKKLKCDGRYPCNRCEISGVICATGSHETPARESIPELKILQQTQSTLTATIHKLYFMVRTAQPWTFGTPKEDSSGTPNIQDIIRKVQHAQIGMPQPRAPYTPVGPEFKAADPCHDFEEYDTTAQQDSRQLNHGFFTMSPWDQTSDKTDLSSINTTYDFPLQPDNQSSSTAMGLNSNPPLQQCMTLNEPLPKMNMNTSETVTRMMLPSENRANVSYSNDQSLFRGRSSEYIEGLLRGLNEFNELARSVGLRRP